jgi:hypothetical protein
MYTLSGEKPSPVLSGGWQSYRDDDENERERCGGLFLIPSYLQNPYVKKKVKNANQKI